MDEMMTAAEVVAELNDEGFRGGGGRRAYRKVETGDGPRFTGGQWYSAGSILSLPGDVRAIDVPWSAAPGGRLTEERFLAAWGVSPC